VVDYDQAWDRQRQAAEARRNDDGPGVRIQRGVTTTGSPSTAMST
jgi:hypothetical protein